MSQLTIDGVEPTQVTDDFIISKVTECLSGKKCSAFGEPKRKWRQAFHAPYKSDQVEIYILNECPSIVVRESRQAVIEYARELIEQACANEWLDQLEDWGVRQIENKEYS